ncbi:hypothetical protein [Vibrio hippocampi]|uniref:Porin n=1 Tax=Vibrio hippocampi TaxID=654686 RepID=A0ABN8DLG1_9VIBR|nr:hypothetical protein [Vibrio hippocampi]CAH0528728.1 hypothetical protein VHP8226_02754 [Vibrio hippocampi]
MKKASILLIAAVMAPAALAAKGSFYLNQAYTDTIEAGIEVNDNNVLFGIEKDDSASRFRMEGYVGYKFNDHISSVLKYRESDNEKLYDDTRWRSETTFSKLGTPEWLLRDVRVRIDHFPETNSNNSERGELRLRNRVRFGKKFQWVFVPEILDINHVDSDDSSRWQVQPTNEFHYKVNKATVSYYFSPRYTVRGQEGWNRIRHTFEVQQRFDNKWRLRAGLRKESTRDIHNGATDWKEDFQYRLSADYIF